MYIRFILEFWSLAIKRMKASAGNTTELSARCTAGLNDSLERRGLFEVGPIEYLPHLEQPHPAASHSLSGR